MIFENCYAPGLIIDNRSFLGACENYNSRLGRELESVAGLGTKSRNTLVMTLDAELFPKATREETSRYPTVLRRVAECLSERGMSATFCIQLQDSPPYSWATPATGMHEVLNVLGPEAIGLHCLHHSTTDDSGRPLNYDADYYREGVDSIRMEYGVTPTYFAQPAWVMTDQSAKNLGEIPELLAARGIQSGPSFWKSRATWNLRFPYIYRGQVYFPYQYVDWNFADIFGRTLDVDVIKSHRNAVAMSIEQPMLMETIGHPFRLSVGDVSENMKVFERTLDAYAASGIRIVNASEGRRAFDALTKNVPVEDWSEKLDGFILRGEDLKTVSAGLLPAKRNFKNIRIGFRYRVGQIRAKLSPMKRLLSRVTP